MLICTNGILHDLTIADKCPSCVRPLCLDCQTQHTKCINWLEREGLGDMLTNTCARCDTVGCVECLRQCSWAHLDASGKTSVEEAPMLCFKCAPAEGIIRVPCSEHYWFLCTREHDFGDENWHSGDEGTGTSYGKRDDMTTYCSICSANSNYCAKMQ
jgi:hypothetical protein